jgi:polyhydroxybutyrate depolymerase
MIKLKVIRRFVFILASFLVGVTVVVTVLYRLMNVANGEIISSGLTRKHLLYVPDTYNPETPTPLVISLHGFAEWPAHIMGVSGWNDLADEHGILVVFPSGTGFPLRWHTSGNGEHRGDTMKDVVYISNLIDTLVSEYNIDTSRIYANGFSNGGGMSHVLACELSDRVAAIGGVAGAYFYPWEKCNPTRPVPMIAFHGTDDKIVPFDGGVRPPDGETLPSIQGWMKIYAGENGCDQNPIQLRSIGDVVGIKYSDCKHDANVHFYTIHGGGHSWPGGGGVPAFIVGYTTQDINATEIMWDFFENHALPDQ